MSCAVVYTTNVFLINWSAEVALSVVGWGSVVHRSRLVLLNFQRNIRSQMVTAHRRCSQPTTAGRRGDLLSRLHEAVLSSTDVLGILRQHHDRRVVQQVVLDERFRVLQTHLRRADQRKVSRVSQIVVVLLVSRWVEALHVPPPQQDCSDEDEDAEEEEGERGHRHDGQRVGTDVLEVARVTGYCRILLFLAQPIRKTGI